MANRRASTIQFRFHRSAERARNHKASDDPFFIVRNEQRSARISLAVLIKSRPAPRGGGRRTRAEKNWYPIDGIAHISHSLHNINKWHPFAVKWENPSSAHLPVALLNLHRELFIIFLRRRSSSWIDSSGSFARNAASAAPRCGRRHCCRRDWLHALEPIDFMLVLRLAVLLLNWENSSAELIFD